MISSHVKKDQKNDNLQKNQVYTVALWMNIVVSLR